jgi:FMN-dependent NADH-azoreductase
LKIKNLIIILLYYFIKELVEKIQSSQGLVIATPTYNFSVPAHLKNFIDRSRFFVLDMEKKNSLGQPVGKLKYLGTYFLVSGGTPKWAETILFFAYPPFWLRGVFLYFGARVFGAYYTGNIRAFENKKILTICQRRGQRFGAQIKQGKKHGILERIFWRPPQV